MPRRKKLPQTQLDASIGSMPRGRVPFDPRHGRCTAAHAEWLRRVRDCKLYKSRCEEWGEFCRKHVGLSGPQATRLIDILEEFGTAYFDLAELTPITPDEFRTVAPMLRGGLLCIDGAAIAIRPENAERIAQAVQKLRRPRDERKRREAPPSRDRLALLDIRCRQLTSEFRKLAEPEGPELDRLQLVTLLRRTLTMLGRIELEIGIY